MRIGMAVPAFVFLSIAALGFWLAQRKARKVKYFQQEELEVGQVRSGEVCKVHGLVETPTPLLSPFSQRPCAWYEVLVQEYVRAGRSSRWVTVHSERRATAFVLKDRKGPGKVEVDLTGAEVLLAGEGGSDDRQTVARYLEQRGDKRLLGYGELRASEATLEPGEKVFVLGTVLEPSPGRLVLSRGKAPFVLSDTDSGQVAYKENNAMYLTRFWAGLTALMGLYWLYRSLR